MTGSKITIFTVPRHSPQRGIATLPEWTWTIDHNGKQHTADKHGQARFQDAGSAAGHAAQSLTKIKQSDRRA